MRRYLAVALLFVAILVLGAPASAFNYYGYTELDELQDLGENLGIPTFRIDNNLYFSGSISNDELSLSFPIVMGGGGGGSWHDINMIAEVTTDTTIDGVLTTGVSEKLFIRLVVTGTSVSETDRGTLIETTRDTEHSGIFTMNMDLQKKAKGQLLILPLINYPEGTHGYVMPLIHTDDGYIVPLIQMPKGHLNNWHGLENEWGLEYDDGVAINYIPI